MIRRRVLTIVLVLLALLPVGAAAQEAQYTLAFRGVPLDAALARFADATGTALAFDPALVKGHRAYCVAEDAPAEELLACLLDVSGLDYYRLSSGTYVLVEPSEAQPVAGHLAGVVTDGVSGAPLPGAHVYLADAGRGAVANDAGRFVVSDVLPGRHAVQVSYLGYTTWRDTIYVSPQRATRAEAALQPETVFVTPVVVAGMRQKLASEALGRSRASRAETLFAPGSEDAFVSATRSPGVRSRAYDVLHLQGGGAGGHALRLDGVPVYQPQLPGLGSPFAASALERVTIDKAGFDALAGSQTAGVLRAEHALGTSPLFDLQGDPLAIDGRVQAAFGEEGGRQVAVMSAARVGLWGVATPPALQSALKDWARPDLFLLEAGGPEEAFRLPRDRAAGSEEPPSLDYVDVHGAARVRFDPLHTIYASGYVGTRALGGGHDAFMPTTAEVDQSDMGTLITAQDRYDWHNRLAQVRYDALVGRRTLVGLQARVSSYALEHDYRVVDSLRVDYAVGRAFVERTTAVSDGNDVTTMAVETTVDYAAGRHVLAITAEAVRTQAAFDLYGPRFASDALAELASGEATYSMMMPPRRSVAHDVSTWRWTLAASERVRLRDGVHLEAGTRLTYVAARQTAYAEPRLALRLDGSTWASRTAAGLYRQYEGRYRTSVLDVGALLPALDVWLPVDGSVRPPVAYHLAQDVLLRPLAPLSIHLEAYYKHQPHQLVPRYAGANDQSAAGLVREQDRFLAAASGYAWGAAATAVWKGEYVRSEVSYERAEAQRRSDEQFEGRRVPVPWNEPHRLLLAGAAHVTPRLTVSAGARAVWGRSWAFRRTYYDYFGHDDETRYHGGYDLGHPEQHVLPPLYEVDVGIAYTRSLARASVQLRLDVQNVLGRRNVLDWRLADEEDGGYRVEPRHLPGRVPLVALRVVL